MTLDDLIHIFVKKVDRDGKMGKDLTLEYVIRLLKEIWNEEE